MPTEYPFDSVSGSLAKLRGSCNCAVDASTLVFPRSRTAFGAPRLAFCSPPPSPFSLCCSLVFSLPGPCWDHFVCLQVKALGPNTGGVLGLEFCNTYDLDLNFERKEVRVYAAGSVDQGMIDTSGLEELSCAFLPGGKLGIKMELNG